MPAESHPLPRYRDLDRSGEARAAAERMEARAREPASAELFAALVEPMLSPEPARVLEVGCGSGALARRLAARAGFVLATDKSEGMLAAAASFGRPDNLRFARWDVLDEAGYPDAESFDLIISSVMVQYLRGEEVAGLVPRLAARLIPGGQLVFVEQDLVTNALAYPSHDLFRRVYDRDAGKLRPHFALGMRPILRAAGLALLPPASFLWTTYRYGPYMRDLNERMADDALARGRIQADERAEWTRTLEALDASGDFYYGLVYHRIAGRRGHSE